MADAPHQPRDAVEESGSEDVAICEVVDESEKEARRTGALAGVLCLPLTAVGAAAPATPGVIAWRGDGTGRFPDATPVTEWGRWPKSPNWGLRHQLKRPKAGDTGENATPVKSGQILEWLVLGPFAAKDPAKVLDEENILWRADTVFRDELIAAGPHLFQPSQGPSKSSPASSAPLQPDPAPAPLEAPRDANLR